MSYFSENYKHIEYPISSKSVLGLRNAQLGAIHAIASFYTLHKKIAGIIVMPTGSGKTAVQMMTPYVLLSQKVLMVTPSKMVRGQTYEDFKGLKTLLENDVVDAFVHPPNVFELKNKYSDEFQSKIQSSDVVIATPQCAISISENIIKKEFDLVLIDEAHHVPAPTWKQILVNMREAKHFLFTATPFRMDKKEIKGEIIYSYPLSMAYQDGIFGEIQYIPIEKAPEKDTLIAKETERILLNDRQRGYNHYIMVRTDTKNKAGSIEKIYKNETSLNLERIDSSMGYTKIKKCIAKLKQGNIDGIICVDMLGEGFDFPNLKIAAIHSPHKSLASTLQFIGRFARTNADNIGEAKFIAMNDEELIIENEILYSTDSIWQKIIIDMSEGRIKQEQELKDNLKNYIHDNGTVISEEDISLYAIRPNCHAKVYRISEFNIHGVFPDFCCVGDNIYRNMIDNTIIGIGTLRNIPKWSTTDQLFDKENHLFIVHYQSETSLLFIYSQMKSEINYESIVKSFARGFDKIPRDEIHRVLGDMDNFELFNTGMQSRYIENGESYRIHAGSNVASAIDATTGRMFSAGHVFCKAINGGNEITIGYSSGSKIWSSKYLQITEYIQWCDSYGLKITNNLIKVQTNTNYDYMPIPTRLIKYPDKIMFCFFSDKTYSSPPVLIDRNGELTEVIITDATIKIAENNDNFLMLEVSISDYNDTIICDINGSYTCRNPTIMLKNGREKLFLVDYLNSCPLLFKATDETIIEGKEILKSADELRVFSLENIYEIDWDQYQADINCECGISNKSGKHSIHTVLAEIIKNASDFDFLLYDHGSGEIADFISVKETDIEIEILFFHVKAMSGVHYNSNVNDIYEVTGQAIKSIIWLKSKGKFLEKMKNRQRSGHCDFEKGNIKDLEELLRRNKLLTARMVIVQPSVSKSIPMPSKYQEILAAANSYIMKSGRVKRLDIWGSS